MGRPRKLELVAQDNSANNVLFSISIPSDSRAPIVQELLKTCLTAFPHNEIELVISTKSSVGKAGDPFMKYEASREFRKEFTSRVKQGIAAAKERGVHFGRKSKVPPKNFAEVLAMWKAREISGAKASKLLGVSPHTFQKWVRE